MKFWNWGPLTIWHTAECPFFFFKNRSTLICSGIQQISEKLDPAFVLNILGYILCTSAMTWLLLSIMSLAGTYMVPKFVPHNLADLSSYSLHKSIFSLILKGFNTRYLSFSFVIKYFWIGSHLSAY